MTPEPGLYRHYKGGLYKVIAIGVDEKTGDRVVIYQSVEDNSWWVRHIADFTERVLVEDRLQARFTQLDTWP